MKITVYQVIQNIGGELTIDAFHTQAEADAKAWDIVKDNYKEAVLDDDDMPDTFESFKEKYDDSLNCCWVEVTPGIHATLHVEPVEIEVPDVKIGVHT